MPGFAHSRLRPQVLMRGAESGMRKINPRAADGAPRVTGTGLSVAEVVGTTYNDGQAAAAMLVEPPLSPEEIRAAIDFCADEACVAEGAFCPCCR